jgi:hypothetical protein
LVWFDSVFGQQLVSVDNTFKLGLVRMTLFPFAAEDARRLDPTRQTDSCQSLRHVVLSSSSGFDTAMGSNPIYVSLLDLAKIGDTTLTCVLNL